MVVFTFLTAFKTPLPKYSSYLRLLIQLLLSPVDAPDGTAALPSSVFQNNFNF